MEGSQPPSSRPLPLPQPPLPEIPTARIERYKLAWRVFMIANLGLGAYMFARSKMKSSSLKTEKTQMTSPPPPPPPPSTPAPPVEPVEEPEIPPTPIAELIKIREPIPEDQRRELFQWILDEKRKVKPKDKHDKKRIDEEKAILKRFIREEVVPPL